MKLRRGCSTESSRVRVRVAAGRRLGPALALATTIVIGLAPDAIAAPAVFGPTLTATSVSGKVTVSYSQPTWNDGLAMLTLYAAPTYVTNLPTKVGAVVGTASANASAAQLGGAIVPFEGTIQVASATTPLPAGGSAATVGEAARACAGTKAPAALWRLTLKGFNEVIPLAIAVQRVDTGPLAGGLALIVCPPPADTPVGTAGRAPLGAKIVRLTLSLTNAFTVPAGTHVWRVVATPYVAGSAVTNPAAAAELVAEQSFPPRLTLVVESATGSRRAAVSGRLTLAGKAVTGQTVRIVSGGKQVGRAATDASGAFKTTVVLPTSRATLTAKARVPAQRLSACARPMFAPIPCLSSIVAGFSAASERVRA